MLSRIRILTALVALATLSASPLARGSEPVAGHLTLQRLEVLPGSSTNTTSISHTVNLGVSYYDIEFDLFIEDLDSRNADMDFFAVRFSTASSFAPLLKFTDRTISGPYSDEQIGPPPPYHRGDLQGKWMTIRIQIDLEKKYWRVRRNGIIHYTGPINVTEPELSRITFHLYESLAKGESLVFIDNIRIQAGAPLDCDNSRDIRPTLVDAMVEIRGKLVGDAIVGKVAASQSLLVRPKDVINGYPQFTVISLDFVDRKLFVHATRGKRGFRVSYFQVDRKKRRNVTARISRGKGISKTMNRGDRDLVIHTEVRSNRSRPGRIQRLILTARSAALNQVDRVQAIFLN